MSNGRQKKQRTKPVSVELLRYLSIGFGVAYAIFIGFVLRTYAPHKASDLWFGMSDPGIMIGLLALPVALLFISLIILGIDRAASGEAEVAESDMTEEELKARRVINGGR